MDIGIVGSGKIGGTAAHLFVGAGHRVAIANSRGPASLAELVEELGPRARAATVPEAATFGEIVLIAIPFGRYADLPADALSGRIVVDASNYYPQRDGNIAALDDGETTSSELLAAHVRGARVVKAFNTMNYRTLATDGEPEKPREARLALLLAGDDDEAKARVAALIEELGFGAVDTGSLAAGGRRQQPGASLYNNPITTREAEAALAAG